MSWRVELKPNAVKQYDKLDKRTRQRITKALGELENTANPLFHNDVRPLVGKLRGDYRLRVGGWRLLFTPDEAQKLIHVYAILPRGDAY